MNWAIRTRSGGCRRKNFRLDVDPPIRIVLQSDTGAFSGELKNISLGGALVTSTSLPSGGRHFTLAHDPDAEIIADVKWREGNTIGLAFESGPEAVGLLARCLRRLVPYGQRRA